MLKSEMHEASRYITFIILFFRLTLNFNVNILVLSVCRLHFTLLGILSFTPYKVAYKTTDLFLFKSNGTSYKKSFERIIQILLIILIPVRLPFSFKRKMFFTYFRSTRSKTLSREKSENARAVAHLGRDVQVLRRKTVPLFMNKNHITL